MNQPPDDSLTQWVLMAILAFALVADVVIIWTLGQEHSFSATISRAGKKYPILPFAVGVFLGHLFWG